MNLSEYGRQYLKYHGAYERYAFRVFRKALKASFANLPIYNLDYSNYELVIALNVNPEPIRTAYYEVYKRVGLLHGARVGRGINREIKDFELPFFNEEFFKEVLQWLVENGGERITSVNDTTIERIKLAIELAQRKNYSVDEMREYLQKTINEPSFTKYHALRIARTEVGSAANFAASVSGKTSGLVLEKVWISTHDARTRDGRPEEWNHRDMDGKTVGQFDKFVMKSNKGQINELEYPWDAKGSAGNVIMCRCTFAYRPKRDENGLPIRR